MMDMSRMIMWTVLGRSNKAKHHENKWRIKTRSDYSYWDVLCNIPTELYECLFPVYLIPVYEIFHKFVSSNKQPVVKI